MFLCPARLLAYVQRAAIGNIEWPAVAYCLVIRKYDDVGATGVNICACLCYYANLKSNW
jgi:hypothetical protein